MNKNMFNELLESVRQSGKTHRGERHAARTFDYSNLNVRATREKISLSQSEFYLLVKTLQS